MSLFANNRIQRAVGQGFFHTATLAEDGNQRLRYIYDCGAKSDYEKERGERIDELLADTGKQAKLDIAGLVVMTRHLPDDRLDHGKAVERSEEHTSELQSLMRISYAVFCLKKKKETIITTISQLLYR